MTEKPSARWSHALVIGGGFAGLLAARVLSDHFERVTIVERDEIGPAAEYRSGVPQAHHPHAVLARCTQVVDELFPGFLSELAAEGAVSADSGIAMRVLLPSGWAPRQPVGVAPQHVTRITLEAVLRRRVLALPQITVLGGVQVEGLTADPANARITGVRGRMRGDQTELELSADLVVDASGRTSRLPDWLATLGFHRPTESLVESGLGYTSRLYEVPEDWPADVLTSYEITHAPHTRRGGAVVVVDKGRCYVLLIGAAGDHAPTDDKGFAAFAQSLRNPDLAEVVAKGTPLSRTYRFTNTLNRWTKFHTLSRWPDRLVAIGDSVCTFNPVYGQGLTVAALEAVELGRLLRKRGAAAEPNGVARTFQRRIARLLRNPWNMTTSTDLGWRAEKAPLSARIAKWFMTAMLDSIPTNFDLYRRFVRVQHMVDPPSVIMRPDVVFGVVAHAVRRRFGRMPVRLDAQPALPEAPTRVDEPFRAA